MKTGEKNNRPMLRIVSNNQITLLQNGEAYFPAMETALDKAIHEIYLESYIFENDNTGRHIAEALRRAALRGVKTHVLIDGFGSHGLPKTMIEFLVRVIAATGNWKVPLNGPLSSKNPSVYCGSTKY